MTVVSSARAGPMLSAAAATRKASCFMIKLRMVNLHSQRRFRASVPAARPRDWGGQRLRPRSDPPGRLDPAFPEVRRGASRAEIGLAHARVLEQGRARAG